MPHQPTPTPFLDTRAAARAVGCSRWTLARMIRAGTGPRTVKTGPQRNAPRLFPRAALELWLVERSGPSARR